MNIEREDLLAAAEQNLLQQSQVEPLLQFLQHSRARRDKADTPRFNGTNVLYYLGGLLAISAASLFATLAVEALGMRALLVLTVIYAACAIGAAAWFEKRALLVPASLFATLAIALTPLAVFALQHVLGFWADGSNAQHYRDYHMWIDWRWIIMELSTLLTGVLMLRRFSYPFLVLPIAVTLWYFGMDILPALFMQTNEAGADWFNGETFELRKKITLAYGLLMLLLAFYVDLRSRHDKDFAYWLYLFGLLTFWGTLSSMGSGQLSGKLIYLALNFGLVFTGAVLTRRVFAVFGGIGIMMVLGDLSWHLFQDSFAFVAVLTLLGFALIGLGIWWSKNETVISAKFRHILPTEVRELLENRATR